MFLLGGKKKSLPIPAQISQGKCQTAQGPGMPSPLTGTLRPFLESSNEYCVLGFLSWHQLSLTHHSSYVLSLLKTLSGPPYDLDQNTKSFTRMEHPLNAIPGLLFLNLNWVPLSPLIPFFPLCDYHNFVVTHSSI